MPGLERRLKAELSGDVQFDRFSRGRYATDASHYQIMPVGVVAPRTIEEAERAIGIARSEGVTVLARGGGTSQAGQTVGNSLVVDCSKYLTRILDLDVKRKRCTVEPGIVLDDLNRQLKPHGLWFPVDISTASRATIGGMAGNNSCGGRSMRYGTMRDNVISIDALLADGSLAHFGRIGGNLNDVPAPLRPLVKDLLAIGTREAGEIAARFPKVQRRVGGYNLDALVPFKNDVNLSHILVGAEGTLGFSTRIELKLSPLLGRRAVGAVHFGSFYEAMNAAQYIVHLMPIAVELIDRTMIELAREIAMFRPTLDKFVRETPAAILLVEFGEDDQEENLRRLQPAEGPDRRSRLRLGQDRREMGRRGRGAQSGTAGRHHRRAHLRPQHHDVDEAGGKAGLLRRGLRGAARASRRLHHAADGNFREARHPRHLVRACRLGLSACAADSQSAAGERRACHARDRRRGLRHGARIQGLAFRRARRRAGALGIQRTDVRLAAGARVRRGEGPLRSERPVQSRQGGAAAEIRRPQSCSATRPAITASRSRPISTGRPIRAPAAVSRARSRCATTTAPAANWPAAPCVRAIASPATSATSRAAAPIRCGSPISGQLGPDALASDEMAETLKLCVSCKACRRECPTGVDMARMKIEVQAARAAKHGFSLHDRLVGWLPRYAPYAARWPWLFNLRDRIPSLRRASEIVAGFSARRSLPKWRKDIYRDRSDWTYRRGEAGGADARRRVCSPTPSIAISSAKISTPPERAGGRRLSRARGAAG